MAGRLAEFLNSAVTDDEGLEETMARRGVSRREFLKFCTVMTGVLALPVD